MAKTISFSLLLLLTYIIQPSECYVQRHDQKYRISTSSRFAPDRLLHLMEVYQQEGTRRIAETNEMRFMYEESPHYEQGFVMGEIVERYRKMVAHVKRPLQFPSDDFFAVLKRTELIQKLYFEIYHLVHMAHEIVRKYQFMPEFYTLEGPDDLQKIYVDQAEQKIKENLEKREKKKKKKFMDKLENFLFNLQQREKKVSKKPYNKWWPLDYGWEIDYLW